jgi:5-keto-L-gluconate epimerase
MKYSMVISTQPAKFQAATFKGDLETNLQTVARLGYAGAELAIRDPKLIDLADLDRMLIANHLQVPAIGTGQAWGEEGLSFTDPDESVRSAAIQRIQSHIPVAAHLGAVIIIGLVRGILKPGVELNQAKSWLVGALRTCSQAARPFGVRLALEPINRYETSLVNNAMEGLDLIECVGEDNFGLLLDTFHMNIEEPSIEESIRNCGDHIFHFHVADSNRWYPGVGHLNFSSILKTLTSQNYAGFVSGEFLPQPDAETAARKSIAFLKQSE